MARKFTATVDEAAVLKEIRMNEAKSISIQVVDAGTNCVISYETSNDRTAWSPAAGIDPNAANAKPVTSSTAVGLLVFPKTGAYFRARVSTYGSGDPEIVGEVSDQDVDVDVRVPATRWSYAALTGGIADVTPVAIKAAAGAGLKNYLKSVQIFNADATVATEVEILSAATVIWRGHVLAMTANAGPAPICANFDPPLESAANEALNVVAVTTSAILYVNAQGYSGK